MIDNFRYFRFSSGSSSVGFEMSLAARRRSMNVSVGKR
ncbi:MAG: hypothetical protein Hyperionvirus41_6 [Hyperionvirus sp.]|uniref:Uncharacterized protein n=1 Tax=Hyperionvirus sp. TaxID=2487770 RepID=A0A3G5AHD7_9VIRU|nr:MAG: hypothetical protein Hyperionvirus41_6 [Hyperionvirus sp.]